MRKIVIILILVTMLVLGLPFALDQRWWLVLVCTLVGLIWAYPLDFQAAQRSVISVGTFVLLGIVGIILGYAPIWILTGYVLLLIAWDLDHYIRLNQEFISDPAQHNHILALFMAHLKRLGTVAGVGWCLGVLALNIRINLSFAFALILVILMMLSLRQLTRHFA